MLPEPVTDPAPTLIEVRNSAALRARRRPAPRPGETVRAVEDVSFAVRKGEVLGWSASPAPARPRSAGPSSACWSPRPAASPSPARRSRTRRRQLKPLRRRMQPAPGPVRLAQPADDRRWIVAALAIIHERPHPRRRAPRAGRAGAAPGRPLPCYLNRYLHEFRRPAPAHRPGPRADHRAGLPGRRRACLGAGRLDPGSDRQPAASHQGRASASPSRSSPTTQPWSGTSPTASPSCISAGSSSWPCARAVPQPAPPLHRSPSSPPPPSRTPLSAASASCSGAISPARSVRLGLRLPHPLPRTRCPPAPSVCRSCATSAAATSRPASATSSSSGPRRPRPEPRLLRRLPCAVPRSSLPVVCHGRASARTSRR